MDYDCLPCSLRSGMRNYLESGIVPGSFLIAILTNNLFLAFQTADPYNKPQIEDIINWVQENAPWGSWGSPEQVHYWRKKKMCERHNREIEDKKLKEEKEEEYMRTLTMQAY